MGGSRIGYVRRLLVDAAEEISVPPASGGGKGFVGGASEDFDTNMVIVLAALLLAVICALGLNSIVRCALRCGDRMTAEEAAARAAATTGMRRRDLRRIPVAAYRGGAGIAEECAICLADFAEGDKVRVLPKCGHGFHVACVDRWLASHSSCPNCRHSLLENKSAASKAACVGGGRRPEVVGAVEGGRESVSVAIGNTETLVA